MTKTRLSLSELAGPARVVPVLTIAKVEQAVPLARALIAGGVRALEVTLRTAVAIECVKAIKAAVPEALVGFGTVVSVDELKLAKDLDLPFAFSPGGTPELFDAAVELGVPFVPGVATASELMAALARGFSTVKFFPAEQAGGAPLLKSLGAPFPQVRFCPTGGITEANMADYLALANVVAVGGSWLVTAQDLEAGNWTAMTERARRLRG